MLRFFYTVCDWLGTFFALLSPVVIIDWLGKATQMKLFEPLHAILAPLTDPLSQTLEMFIHLPPMHFNGQDIPLTQGVLGIVFTGCFFVCTFAGQVARTTDQRLKVTQEMMGQHLRLQKIKAEEAKNKKKNTANHELLVFIACEYHEYPSTGTIFETGVSRFGGKNIQTTANSMLVSFPKPENGLRFALDCGHEVLDAYKKLRPLDPQPPFRIGLHAAHETERESAKVAICSQVIQYANKNDAVFTQQARDFLDALGHLSHFKHHPIGSYSFAGAGNQDVYRLVL